jgi:hypothetical protein
MQAADRFMTMKFLQPRRWDVVTFRHRRNLCEATGLPGEEIIIKDGAVWADGVRLNPPPSLGEIEYLSEIDGYFGTLSGTEKSPAHLREGEYFVLGDFSAFSADSRFWTRGASDTPRTRTGSIYWDVTHLLAPSRWRLR